MNDILEEIENIAPKGFVSESQKCGKATKEDPIPKLIFYWFVYYLFIIAWIIIANWLL
jgi:hypothetical protein